MDCDGSRVVPDTFGAERRQTHQALPLNNPGHFLELMCSWECTILWGNLTLMAETNGRTQLDATL